MTTHIPPRWAQGLHKASEPAPTQNNGKSVLFGSISAPDAFEDNLIAFAKERKMEGANWRAEALEAAAREHLTERATKGRGRPFKIYSSWRNL